MQDTFRFNNDMLCGYDLDGDMGCGKDKITTVTLNLYAMGTLIR